MKTPVCELDLKAGFLCPACKKKLEDGEISQLDVDVSFLLYKLYKKGWIDNDLDFRKAIPLKNIVLLLVKGNIAKLIGKGGRVVRYLSTNLGKRVRVVEASNIKKIIQDLIYPARLFGLNIVFLPDGEMYKVVIPKEDRKRLGMRPDELREALTKLLDKPFDIIFV